MSASMTSKEQMDRRPLPSRYGLMERLSFPGFYGLPQEIVDVSEGEYLRGETMPPEWKGARWCRDGYLRLADGTTRPWTARIGTALGYRLEDSIDMPAPDAMDISRVEAARQRLLGRLRKEAALNRRLFDRMRRHIQREGITMYVPLSTSAEKRELHPDYATHEKWSPAELLKESGPDYTGWSRVCAFRYPSDPEPPADRPYQDLERARADSDVAWEETNHAHSIYAALLERHIQGVLPDPYKTSKEQLHRVHINGRAYLYAITLKDHGRHWTRLLWPENTPVDITVGEDW